MTIERYTQMYLLDRMPRNPNAVHLKCIQICDGYKVFLGVSEIRDPLHFTIQSGDYFHDLLRTTWAAITIFRERIADIFEEGGFTGWKRYPIVIHDRAGEIVPGYCGISITGKGGKVEDDRSEPVTVEVFTNRIMKVPSLKGIYLENDYYDGSDIFVPEGTAYIVVKEAVRDALMADPDLNLNLVPLCDHVRYHLSGRKRT